MLDRRKLPRREHVFVHSLMYHGYRFVSRRHDLKRRKGYVISSTKREDSEGIDFWVKKPCHSQLIPVQVTQRGVRFFRKNHQPSHEKLREFIERSDKRVRQKRKLCIRNHIAFALVRDYGGRSTSPSLAASDVRALRFALMRFKD